MFNIIGVILLSYNPLLLSEYFMTRILKKEDISLPNLYKRIYTYNIYYGGYMNVVTLCFEIL